MYWLKMLSSNLSSRGQQENLTPGHKQSDVLGEFRKGPSEVIFQYANSIELKLFFM